MHQICNRTTVDQNQTTLGAARLRAVFVDDVPELLECLTDRVRGIGVIDVIGTACNGLEALRIATSLKPDLVVMDVNMPVMDGVAAAREIKKAAPGIQVILMSAEDSPALRDLAIQAGANEFIAKADLLLSAPLLLKMLAS
jgi:CheY-like chemotaxis protein